MNWTTRQSAFITLLAMLFGLGMIFILAYQVNSSYQVEIQRTRLEAAHQSSTIASQISSSLREIDIILKDLSDKISPDDLSNTEKSSARNQELQNILLDKLLQIHQADNIMLVSSNSNISHRALDTPGSGQLINNDYFQLVRNNRYQEKVYARLSNRSENTGIIVARRVESLMADFSGLIVASVTRNYLDNLLSNQNIGKHASIHLIDQNKGVLAKYPSHASAPIFDDFVIQNLMNGKESSALISHTEPTQSISSYHPIKDTPFIVVVNVSSEDYLLPWHKNTLYYLFGGGILLIMALLMCYFFWRSHRLTQNLHKKEKYLNASEARFRQMIETSPVAIVLARMPDYFITYINHQAAELFDQTQAGALSQRAFELYKSKLTFMEQVQRIQQGDAQHNIEVLLQRKDGQPFWGNLSMSVHETNQSTTIMIGISDITSKKQLEADLQHRATIDSLSGLFNRAYFTERANHEIARAKRNQQPLIVIMLDIDHFKKINDNWGHDTGDIAIQSLAGLCQSTLRDIDIIGRIGGEEFAILLPETDLEKGFPVAERLRQRIEAQRILLTDKQTLQFTASLGLTILEEDDQKIDRILKRADQALYQAKHDGRNQTVIFNKQ
ncbi:sensor domain-containing diguanylate cyclase [Iodobacter fluviatilis]|uniref:diguanylate cyclase n=1 Tax=Iodobacter fluviatilis TaxID=537 RepID=A0A377Q9E2_9NEIS|nr:diguanylate cyclase [Iodobacter fluviatilis]TCU89113.1 PAS domain S-box-containing protein/diguanylate cyclase (GGDEF)-like protein [Iodobacter fluviatilis]STQ90481.1 Probable diguanylate cyclase YcdT [Iodobacter fluviatilis]